MELKAGDVCLDCQQQGLVNRLRSFKLNLHGDTLLKCESNECMYPYNDDISSSSDEAEAEFNGLELIDDLLQQINNATETTNSNGIQLIEDLIQQKDNEPLPQFEISFLNALEDELKTGNFQNAATLAENDNKPNTCLDIKESQTLDFLGFLDDKTGITKCKQRTSLLTSYQTADNCINNATTNIKETHQSADNCKAHIYSLPSLDDDGSQLEFINDYKTKVEMQSTKTLKTEPLNDNLPKTSSKLMSKKSKPVSKTITSTKCSPSSCSSKSQLKFSTKLTTLSEPDATTTSTTMIKPTITSTTSINPVNQTTLSNCSISNDIPKANITGRLLLEQFKIASEKTTNSLNRKIKQSNRKLKIKYNCKVKVEPLADDSDNTQDSCKSSDDCHSIDSISQLLSKRKLQKEK